MIVLSSRNLSNQGYQSTMRTLNAALQKAVQQVHARPSHFLNLPQGLILRSEMARMKNGMWAMTVEESTSLMDGLGFTILRSETWQSADPYWAALEVRWIPTVLPHLPRRPRIVLPMPRASRIGCVHSARSSTVQPFSPSSSAQPPQVTLFAAVSPDRRAAAAAFAFAEFKAAVEANCIEDRHWVDYNNHLLILQRN